MKKLSFLLITLASLVFVSHAMAAREQIRVVGSSTVYPLTTTVAENFGKIGKFKTPVVESTGTGGGLKLFCAGVGEDHPDVANASRRIKDSEIEDCKKNGVKSITEIKIGFDGIAFANSINAKPVEMKKSDIFNALARKIEKDGKLVDNPNQTWKDVNPSLPDIKIEVYGPPPTSGTRDSFVELVMVKVCEKLPAFEAEYADKKDREKACALIREDGAYVEAGENDNLIIQKLTSNENAFGIFGYDFLEQNRSKVRGNKVDGIEPTFETIAGDKYPISRAMYVYVKNDHDGIVSGLKEFVHEYTSDKAMGQAGYLKKKGLVPLPSGELKKVQNDAKEGKAIY